MLSTPRLGHHLKPVFTACEKESSWDYYYCVDSEGTKRDVGGSAWGIMAGGFIGLILLGIFMIILSDKLKFPRPKIAKSPKA